MNGENQACCLLEIDAQWPSGGVQCPNSPLLSADIVAKETVMGIWRGAHAAIYTILDFVNMPDHTVANVVFVVFKDLHNVRSIFRPGLLWLVDSVVLFI